MTNRLFVLAATTSLSVALFICGPSLLAKQSSLEQSIEPIVCQYVKISDGTTTTTSTECEDQTIPKLETANAASRQIKLNGYFSASSTKTLRVWIAGSWFTLGSYQNLTTVGDEWYLEVANVGLFAAGSYDVVIETITEDGYLLRTLYEDALKIPRINIIQTNTDYGGGTSRSLVKQTISDDTIRSQADTRLPFNPNFNMDEFSPMLGRDITPPLPMVMSDVTRPASHLWLKILLLTIFMASLLYMARVLHASSKSKN